MLSRPDKDKSPLRPLSSWSKTSTHPREWGSWCVKAQSIEVWSPQAPLLLFTGRTVLEGISSKAILGLTEKIKSQRVFTGNTGVNPKFNWSGCKDLNLFFRSFNLSFHSFVHACIHSFSPSFPVSFYLSLLLSFHSSSFLLL